MATIQAQLREARQQCKDLEDSIRELTGRHLTRINEYQEKLAAERQENAQLVAKVKELTERLDRAERRVSKALDVAEETASAANATALATRRAHELLDEVELRLRKLHQEQEKRR